MIRTYLTSDDLEAACWNRTLTHGDVHLELRDESPVMVSGNRVIAVVQR